MNYIHVLGYFLLFCLLLTLLHPVQRESFRPLRVAYNRAHKTVRRGWRPYQVRLQQWLLPYKRMFL